MKYSREDLAYIKNGRAEQRKTSASMAGKLCVVTGATSGVGLAAARRLAAGGANLVLVARSREKAEAVKAELEAAYPVAVHLVIADFSRLADVRKAAAEILAGYPAVDVLINAAGLHCTRRRLTEDGNELVFQVNHLASFLLTMLLLPNIKKSPQGRILQVNSQGHRFGGLNLNDLDWAKRHYFGLRAYGASKTAQIMTVWTLAELLRDTAVTINAMHPGAVRTAIGQNNGQLYRAWQRVAVRPFLKNPAISGEALHFLAAAPELTKTTGRFFNLTIDEKPMPHALDSAVRDKVWALSLSMTGLPQAF